MSLLSHFGLAVFFVLPAAAQTVTGSLVGHVADPTDAPIAGAKVEF